MNRRGWVTIFLRQLKVAVQMEENFLLAYSMTDLSTTVFRGETAKPVARPARMSARMSLSLFC